MMTNPNHIAASIATTNEAISRDLVDLGARFREERRLEKDEQRAPVATKLDASRLRAAVAAAGARSGRVLRERGGRYFEERLKELDQK